MRVVISGASGLIGTALSASLREGGHSVVALVRRQARSADESSWAPAAGTIDLDVIASADAIVNLAGASIGARRLTSSYQQVVRQSRVDSTSTIARAIVQAKPDAVLLQGSAMGYYGSRGEEPLSERSSSGQTFLASICRDWEAAAVPAQDAGARVVYLRTGLVLAPHGGFAERLLPLVRRGLISSLGSGRAWHSWISLQDAIRALEFHLTSGHHGASNVIAPVAVRDRPLITALCEAMGTSPGLSVPAWAMRLAVGPAADDLLNSQLASPGVLNRLGFTWDHAQIDAAARWIVTPD
ncbi:TIGR01777 family oxidoreductase [Demequina capsici]|uniref:TIGR01777 family oxidoreductase n=1 Tax=Demequina capsici TaxID=3075620 RepID=A0AA96F966_9MICO|nr:MULTISPECIES: TIGR01777 family oxidoreductase [unclassified Demequina]WNM25657.1 TIGR01777 family oxidoreductase [Demequina sp. OYTSA14]WNM28552.1 TIGR01777 family oxidoreductase [Demequina sp. PMTSA13]